jgi:hypothetical protein
MARVIGLPKPLADAVGAVGDERTLVAGTGEHRVAPFLEITQADWEEPGTDYSGQLISVRHQRNMPTVPAMM